VSRRKLLGEAPHGASLPRSTRVSSAPPVISWQAESKTGLQWVTAAWPRKLDLRAEQEFKGSACDAAWAWNSPETRSSREHDCNGLRVARRDHGEPGNSPSKGVQRAADA